MVLNRVTQLKWSYTRTQNGTAKVDETRRGQRRENRKRIGERERERERVREEDFPFSTHIHCIETHTDFRHMLKVKQKSYVEERKKTLLDRDF